MKIVGVIVAKENSNRFKGKNYYMYYGYPLFWHNVQTMIDAGITEVFVATDSKFIKDYCEDKNVSVIWRNDNINQDDQPIFDVLKYVHLLLGKYDIMVNILANTINVKADDITRMLKCLKDNNLKEVRSYDSNGVENGCMIFKSEVFNKHEISAYVGAITTNSKEIHYEREITGS